MRVRYTKWGDRPHWHFAVEHIGRDRYGLWLGGRSGIRQQRADEPPITAPHDFVMLLPDDGCYTAFWNADGPIELYVDVTTRPVVNDGIIAAVDLDLDVIRLAPAPSRSSTRTSSPCTRYSSDTPPGSSNKHNRRQPGSSTRSPPATSPSTWPAPPGSLSSAGNRAGSPSRPPLH